MNTHELHTAPYTADPHNDAEPDVESRPFSRLSADTNVKEFSPPVSLFKSAGGEKKYVILGILALQATLIASLVIPKEMALNSQNSITLLAHPADPVDPLRGTYVQLSYDIADAVENKHPELSELEAGTPVWVTVAPIGLTGHTHHQAGTDKGSARPVYRYVDVNTVKPRMSDAQKDSYVIKGTVDGYHDIKFGVEQIYVSESLDQSKLPSNDFRVLLAVSPAGTLAVRQVASGPVTIFKHRFF